MSYVSFRMTLLKMMRARKPGPRRQCPVALLLACSLTLGAWCGAERAARADAALGSNDRHPQSGTGAILAPSGVPAAYVFTHHGWFHPSCVVRVQSDEVVGADLVVRGQSDGAARFSFGPCAYPRFDVHGRAMGAGSAAPPVHAAPQPAAAIYDGYIVYYAYNGGITPGSTLVTDEIVPPPPTNVANQDIAFFNDILTTAGTDGDILQPVLDFNGETRGKWSIESEHCCIANNDMQTTPVVVAPGDQIRGTVTGTGCATTGVCSAWSVTTADVTTGKSTTLNTTAPNGVPDGVSPGSLETYGVTACDMFPAGGETTFTGNTLTDPGGNLQTLKYRLINFDGVDPEVPTNCGYGGKLSGDDFTLIYGTVTSGAGGATSTGGAAGGGGQAGQAGRAGTGGRAGASGSGAGGQAGAVGQGSGGATGAGGTKGSGGVIGSGGATGSGGVTGSGGAMGATGSGGVTGSGGTTGSGGAAGAKAPGGGAAGESSDSSGGCSCSTGASGGSASTFGLLMFALAVVSTRTRRRRRA